MRTLHHTTTADGITIRLIEREEKPRFVITQHTSNFANFLAIGNDREQAVLFWIEAVERAQTRVVVTGRAS